MLLELTCLVRKQLFFQTGFFNRSAYMGNRFISLPGFVFLHQNIDSQYCCGQIMNDGYENCATERSATFLFFVRCALNSHFSGYYERKRSTHSVEAHLQAKKIFTSVPPGNGSRCMSFQSGKECQCHFLQQWEIISGKRFSI